MGLRGRGGRASDGEDSEAETVEEQPDSTAAQRAWNADVRRRGVALVKAREATLFAKKKPPNDADFKVKSAALWREIAEQDPTGAQFSRLRYWMRTCVFGLTADAAGVTVLYGEQLVFDRLAWRDDGPGWAPQPDWQLAFAAAAAELTDNHWIDDLKVRAPRLTTPTTYEYTLSSLLEYSVQYAVLSSRHTTLGCATLLLPMGSTDHKSSA